MEAPARVLRLYAMLIEAVGENWPPDMPPQALARIQRLVETARVELERSISPALAAELREFLGPYGAHPDAAGLRLECVGLLGWLSGLVTVMLDELDAACSSHEGDML